MTTRILRFSLIVFISGLIGYYIGVTNIAIQWKMYKPHVVVTSKEPPSSVMHMDLSKFWQVLEKIENSYYDKTAINSQKMLDGAISGMVESLDDPYTVYLPPVQNKDFKDGLAGQFSGIGAELGLKEKQVIVVAPLDGSPAKQAGIKSGDTIIKVDDEVAYGWTINQAVEKIRGPKGTDVTLQVVHKGEESPVDITITRDTITVKSVTSSIEKIKDVDGINLTNELKANQDKKVAYIRLSQFGDFTNKEWETISNNVHLQMSADKDIIGIVLDLRNNPGGYLTDAVFITSEFIKSGTVVMQEDGKGKRLELPVSRQGLLLEVPLVVLINKGSASASEIVAGALSDYDRATLVGETSFGKGTIQHAEDLGGGAGLHVTIAKWLTPKGTWVHKKGLTPDVAVEIDQKDKSHDVQLERAIEELIQ